MSKIRCRVCRTVTSLIIFSTSESGAIKKRPPMNSSVKGKGEKSSMLTKSGGAFSFFRERSKHNWSGFQSVGSLPDLHLHCALERDGRTEERFRVTRSVGARVSTPELLLHSPTCEDALDRVRSVSGHARCPSASGSSVQIVGGSNHHVPRHPFARTRSSTSNKTCTSDAGDSAQFTMRFLASGLYLPQAEAAPSPLVGNAHVSYAPKKEKRQNKNS